MTGIGESLVTPQMNLKKRLKTFSECTGLVVKRELK
jgi:hypothetical protein